MGYSLNNEVVRASAGSGKTFKLSNRYLELILSGVPVDTILATTFTRAAAGEIQNRILSRLGQGASSPENARSLFNALASDDPNFPAAAGINADNAQDVFQTKLAEIVRELQRLRISTLDSFFMQLAGGYAFEMGLPANWHIVEELDSQRLLFSALLDMFAQARSEDAVTLARSLFKGDYSRSIAYETITLINNNVGLYYDSERSPKPWIRLEKELKGLERGDLDTLLDQLTFVKALPDVQPEASQAKSSPLFAALNKLEELLAQKNWQELLGHTLVKNINTGKYYRKPIPDPVLEVLRSIRQYASISYLEESSERTRAMWGTLNAISAYFERAKAENGAYRFDDLARALRAHSISDRTNQLFYRLDSRTSHILLDEFQDASFTQWAVIRPFAESIVRRGDDGSFYCVGDVKQAIYGWRGGKAEIFDAISTDLSGVRNASLAVNWRSCPVVLDIVNKLFNSADFKANPVFQLRDKKNDESYQLIGSAINNAVARWSKGFTDHKCAPKNQSLLGYWTLEQAPVVDEDLMVSDPRKVPVYNELEFDPCDKIKFEPESIDDDDEESENAFESASSRLQKRLQKQATLQYAVERIAKFHELYPNATIGVLARTNKYIAKLTTKLKERFKGQNVVISEEGGAPIVDSPAINAILSVLSLAAHTNNSVAAFHVAKTTPFSEKFNLTLDNYDAKYTPKKVSDAIRKELEARGLGHFIAGLRDLLVPTCINPLDKERLDKLVEFAYSYQDTCDRFQLDKFIRAVREYKTESPSASTIRVMSLHKSKGLQFDVVVLPELDAQIDRTPSGLCEHYEDPQKPVKIDGVVNYVSVDKLIDFEDSDWIKETIAEQYAGEVQEALNLLYVGVTRPVRALCAIVAPDCNKEEGVSLTFAKILKYGLTGERCNITLSKEPEQRDLRAKILYQAGTPDWYDDAEFRPKTETSQQVSQAPMATRELREGIQAKRLLFHRATPTGDNVSREWTADSEEAMQRGTALHKCFEAIRWIDVDGIPSDERLRELLCPILLYDNDLVEKTLEEFKTICATDFTRRLLSSSSYIGDTEVKRERQFSVSYERGGAKAALVRGTIDRLVLTRENGRVVAADVIDYKSNQYNPNATYEHYDEQLREYGKAVRVMYKLDPAQIKLRYVFVGQEWPDEERERLVEFN